MAKKLTWTLEYSVHLEEIDDQHKRFFALIDALSTLLETKTIELDPLLIVLTHLCDYAFYHFATEEGYFRIFRYEHADDHIRQHDAFREKARELLEQARNAKPELLRALAEKAADFARTWLQDHILIEDKKFMPLFRAKGVR